jgi:hypothetical protein
MEAQITQAKLGPSYCHYNVRICRIDKIWSAFIFIIDKIVFQFFTFVIKYI